MISYDCPHCHARLQAAESIAGQDQSCPQCNERTIVPVLKATLAPPARPAAPGIITIPLLISAIWNSFAALGWICTCVGVVFAAPLIVLLVFEFMLYAHLTSPDKRVEPSRVRTIAICEIVAGLVSFAPLVCGIIILANLNKVDINAGKLPANPQ